MGLQESFGAGRDEGDGASFEGDPPESSRAAAIKTFENESPDGSQVSSWDSLGECRAALLAAMGEAVEGASSCTFEVLSAIASQDGAQRILLVEVTGLDGIWVRPTAPGQVVEPISLSPLPGNGYVSCIFSFEITESGKWQLKTARYSLSCCELHIQTERFGAEEPNVISELVEQALGEAGLAPVNYELCEWQGDSETLAVCITYVRANGEDVDKPALMVMVGVADAMGAAGARVMFCADRRTMPVAKRLPVGAGPYREWVAARNGAVQDLELDVPSGFDARVVGARLCESIEVDKWTGQRGTVEPWFHAILASGDGAGEAEMLFSLNASQTQDGTYVVPPLYQRTGAVGYTVTHSVAFVGILLKLVDSTFWEQHGDRAEAPSPGTKISSALRLLSSGSADYSLFMYSGLLVDRRTLGSWLDQTRGGQVETPLTQALISAIEGKLAEDAIIDETDCGGISVTDVDYSIDPALFDTGGGEVMTICFRARTQYGLHFLQLCYHPHTQLLDLDRYHLTDFLEGDGIENDGEPDDGTDEDDGGDDGEPSAEEPGTYLDLDWRPDGGPED